MEILADKLDKLTSHHFIAKHQSSYLAKLKVNIHQNEAVVLLDFAENYSFLIQVQGFHWGNSQATIHPFVAYYKDHKGETCHISMCVISDHWQHSTTSVHRFQREALSYLQDVRPNLSNMCYFSDGAASQYKDFKNFSNLKPLASQLSGTSLPPAMARVPVMALGHHKTRSSKSQSPGCHRWPHTYSKAAVWLGLWQRTKCEVLLCFKWGCT